MENFIKALKRGDDRTNLREINRIKGRIKSLKLGRHHCRFGIVIQLKEWRAISPSCDDLHSGRSVNLLALLRGRLGAQWRKRLVSNQAQPGLPQTLLNLVRFKQLKGHAK